MHLPQKQGSEIAVVAFEGRDDGNVGRCTGVENLVDDGLSRCRFPCAGFSENEHPFVHKGRA
jgi:hypothetical protein